ncbi:hypothetical protein ANCDUO_03992 [Ancylostoma duodenale]|uniref:Uncharacterized protein n=1 Tax=Ancylostoma duodenale TaxID=51022 RepID=A0A0C2H279_9BILA|nr:hypothetical protein ANCDUO_03992 [Ancylostoma duodenale]
MRSVARSTDRVMLEISRLTQGRCRLGARLSMDQVGWTCLMPRNDNRWAGAVKGWTPWNVKSTKGKSLTRWSNFSTKPFEETYNALHVPSNRYDPLENSG